MPGPGDHQQAIASRPPLMQVGGNPLCPGIRVVKELDHVLAGNGAVQNAFTMMWSHEGLAVATVAVMTHEDTYPFGAVKVIT
jgi:hypothetical protein